MNKKGRKRLTVEQKQTRVEEVLKLKRKHWTLWEIAKSLGITYATARHCMSVQYLESCGCGHYKEEINALNKAISKKQVARDPRIETIKEYIALRRQGLSLSRCADKMEVPELRLRRLTTKRRLHTLDMDSIYEELRKLDRGDKRADVTFNEHAEEAYLNGDTLQQFNDAFPSFGLLVKSNAWQRAAKRRYETDIKFAAHVEEMVKEGIDHREIVDITHVPIKTVKKISIKIRRNLTKCEHCGESVQKTETTLYKGKEIYPDHDDRSDLPLKNVCRYCLYGGKEEYDRVSRESPLIGYDGLYGNSNSRMKVFISGI